MTNFDDAAVAAVLAHMNDDHDEDNLTIVRAFGAEEATAGRMTGLDELGGEWVATTEHGDQVVRVPWPGGPISERPEIRREVVAVHTQACGLLGIVPPTH